MSDHNPLGAPPTPPGHSGLPPEKYARRPTVVHRHYDINGWLVLLVLILAVPAGMWGYEHFGPGEPASSTPVAPPVETAPTVTEMPPSVEATPTEAPRPVEPPVTVVETPHPLAPSHPSTTAPAVKLRNVRYQLLANPTGNFRIQYTNAEGKQEWADVQSTWVMRLKLPPGTNIYFSCQSGAWNKEHVTVEIYVDNVLWKRVESQPGRPIGALSGKLNG